MSGVFLGRWWHWLLLVLLVGLLWMAGRYKMHVIHFNWFVFLLLVGTGLLVVVLVKATSAGERVTRDEIVDSPVDDIVDDTDHA